jgi:hypothetical protein
MMIVNVEESGGNSFGGRIDRREERRRGIKHEKITITFPVIDIGSFTG